MRAILSTALGVMMTLSAAHAQQQPQVQIQINSLRFEHVDRQQVQAEIVMSAIAPKGWHLDRIELSNIRVNGVPVFADPVEADIKTTGGFVVLPPLHMHVYLEDIGNASGLEQALREQQASISAVAAVEVGSNLLQRLILGKAHPIAVLEIRKTVPVHLADGLTGRGMRLLLTTGIDLARPLARTFKASVDSSGKTANDSAVVHTCWTSPEGERRCTHNLAFMVGSRYITAAQAAEPWRFDPLLIRLAPINLKSIEVTLESGGATTQVTASIHGIPRSTRVLLMSTGKWTSYADADSKDVYAELQPIPAVSPVLVQLSESAIACGASSWQNVRMYRLAQDGRGVSPLSLLVRSENGTLRFSRPLDEDTVGSPIIGAEGVIGVVQSERAGAAITLRGDCPAS